MGYKQPINPAELSPPIGFAHGWLVQSESLRTVYLAGQCAHAQDGTIQAKGDLAGQIEHAMRNVGAVLREAGLDYEDVVQLNFYVRSRDDYATARRQIGKVWRELCGKHFPAMAMFEVSSLFDLDALIEIQGIAAR